MLLKDIVKIKGGKRLPAGEFLTDIPNSHPYIRVRDLNKTRLELTTGFQYVPDNIFKKISLYTTNSGDILISIVGTIGLLSIVGKSLDNASLTENCVKLINPQNYLNNYLFYFLLSRQGQKQIYSGTVGSTQPKLPIYNIEKIVIPDISLSEQQHIVNILGIIDSY